MSEPIVDLGIGFLFAALLALGIVAAMRMRASRSAVLRLRSLPPPSMTVIEADIMRSREECARLQDHIEEMTKQVETTWASERMANAVLRERINDVASEVVRVAVALEGLNSPIDSLVAGKAASAQALNDDITLAGESREISLPSALDVAEGTSTELIHRIRALRQRTARTPATS